MNASPLSGAVRRHGLMLAACAVAGGLLRWLTPSNNKSENTGIETALPPAAQSFLSRVRVETLIEMPAHARLSAVLKHLRLFTAEEISRLVEAQLAEAAEIEHGLKSGDTAQDRKIIANALLRSLFMRWAELDASGMLAALESPALRYALDARQLALNALVELKGLPAIENTGWKWPALARRAAWETFFRRPGDLEKLLPWLKGGRPGEVEKCLPEGWSLERLLGPERSLFVLAETGDAVSLKNAVKRLGAEDFTGALLAVKTLPPGLMREAALQPLLDAMVFDRGKLTPDVEGLFGVEYEALPAGNLRDEFAPYYAALVARNDPERALELTRSLPAGQPRIMALAFTADGFHNAGRHEEAAQLLLTEWMKENRPLSNLLREASLLNHPRIHMMFSSPVVPGGTTSLNSSVEYEAPAWPPGGQPWSVIHDAVYQWARKDPKAAVAWLAAVPDPELRSHLAGTLPASLAEDPTLMVSSDIHMQFWESVVNNPYFDISGNSIPDISHVNRNRLAEVVPEPWRNTVWLYLTAQMSVSIDDWQTAGMDDRRFISVAWMKTDSGAPENLWARFNELSPEERSLNAWYEAGRARVRMDSEEASRWMNSLPPGPERDTAATALVEHLTTPGRNRDGEAAFAWAASMSGEAERRRFMAQAVRAWAEDDSAAAGAAISAARLPASEEAALQRNVQEGGGL